MLASLEEADVHVVLTVRDAARTIPAQWQTVCRNGGKVPYRRFVYGVRAALDPERRTADGRRRCSSAPRAWPGCSTCGCPWWATSGCTSSPCRRPGPTPPCCGERFAEVVGVRSRRGRPAGAQQQHLSGARVDRAAPPREHRARQGPPARPRRRHQGTAGPQDPRDPRVAGDAAPAAPARPRLRRPVELARAQSITAHEVHVVGDLDDLPTGRPAPDLPKNLAQPSDQELLAAAATARDGLHEYLDHLRVTLETRDPSPQKPAQTFDPSGDWSTTTAEHWDSHGRAGGRGGGGDRGGRPRGRRPGPSDRRVPCGRGGCPELRAPRRPRGSRPRPASSRPRRGRGARGSCSGPGGCRARRARRRRTARR